MFYTTTDAVRDEAGFNGNEYVADPSIEAQILRANAVINTYVGSRYRLPFDDELFRGSNALGFLSSLEVQLAAGYLLINEYGSEARNTDKDGFRRVDDAMKILENLQAWKISLFDKDGNLFPAVSSENTVTSTRPRGLATERTFPRRFSVNDRY